MAADPYANTTIGADGRRYATSDTAGLAAAEKGTGGKFADQDALDDLEAYVDSIDNSVRTLPTGFEATVVSAAALVVPFTKKLVHVGLADAVSAPVVLFSNPGVGAFAEFLVELANADDTTSPVVTLPKNVFAASTLVTGQALTAPASTKKDLYHATVHGQTATARVKTDGVTATSTALTSATLAFTQADVGAVVTGTGVAVGTTIDTVTNATTVVLSKATTAMATGVTITVTPGPSRVDLALVRANY